MLSDDSGVRTPISTPQEAKSIKNAQFQANIAVCAPRFGIKLECFRVITVESSGESYFMSREMAEAVL